MHSIKRFPHIPDHLNLMFEREKRRWDYIFLRPILLILYFFVRCICFPLKYVFHRRSYGFERYIIDGVLSFGIKYVATPEAVEILFRHIQIEPVIYRHLLRGQKASDLPEKDLNGINGRYNVDSLGQIIKNNMTIGHDELSYELIDRFEKSVFLDNIDEIRRTKPFDIEEYSRKALEINAKHSFKLIGVTNVVLTIVYTITLFSDLKTAMQALNSFGSDSVTLWALKHLYRYDADVLTDLDFYLQTGGNRSHYDNSAFFSNPSQYLFYHIVFDEYVYDVLRNRAPSLKANS